MRWKALAEIYTKQSFAPFFNLNFWSKLLKCLLFFAEILLDFAEILIDFAKFWFNCAGISPELGVVSKLLKITQTCAAFGSNRRKFAP